MTSGYILNMVCLHRRTVMLGVMPASVSANPNPNYGRNWPP